MKKTNIVFFASIILLLGVLTVLGGCMQAEKKPISEIPGNRTTPNISSPNAPNAPNVNNSTNSTSKYPKQVADKVVTEANKVDGVSGATAVISGKSIYIGLDITPDIEKSKTADVEKMVLSRVKKMEPGYTCSVASDVDTVTRIRKVSQGVAQGKPISSFGKELQEIGNRLTPKTE